MVACIIFSPIYLVEGVYPGKSQKKVRLGTEKLWNYRGNYQFDNYYTMVSAFKRPDIDYDRTGSESVIISPWRETGNFFMV